MNCLEFQEMLQRRLDGETALAPPDFDLHLSACPSCQERHAATLRLLEGIKSLPRVVFPEDLGPRIIRSVLADRQRRLWRGRVRVLVTTGLAASLLAMALSGYFLLPDRKARSPEAEPELV